MGTERRLAKKRRYRREGGIHTFFSSSTFFIIEGKGGKRERSNLAPSPSPGGDIREMDIYIYIHLLEEEF